MQKPHRKAENSKKLLSYTYRKSQYLIDVLYFKLMTLMKVEYLNHECNENCKDKAEMYILYVLQKIYNISKILPLILH